NVNRFTAGCPADDLTPPPAAFITPPALSHTVLFLPIAICRCYDENIMVGHTVPKTTAFEAQAAANLFLLNHLPDRFLAAVPSFDNAAQVWRVPIVVAYPVIGP